MAKAVKNRELSERLASNFLRYEVRARGDQLRIENFRRQLPSKTAIAMVPNFEEDLHDLRGLARMVPYLARGVKRHRASSLAVLPLRARLSALYGLDETYKEAKIFLPTEEREPMVKKIARSLILGAASFFLVACNGGDDDGGGGPNPTNTPGTSPTNTRQASPTNTPQASATNTPQGSPTNTPVGSPTETAEATATETPEESPTPTSTPGSVLTGEQAVQAFASGLVTSLTRLGDLAGGGGAGSGSQISVPAPCGESGTVTVECVPDGAGSETTFTFDACRNVNEEAQVDAFIDGTIVQATPEAGCLMPLPEDFTFLTISVIGDVDVSASGRNVSGNLDVMLDILRYEDGTRDILLDALGTIDCVGEFDAFGDVIVPADTVCPVDGRVDLTLPDGDSAISFFDGAVDLDYDNDGTPDDSVDSCEDSSLATCQ